MAQQATVPQAMSQQSASLADPQGASVLVAAVNWLSGTLFGTIAIVLATISIAMVGLMMLSGRVDLRRGATVIIGCFILFGASGIAAGLRGAANGDGYAPPRMPVLGPPPVAPRRAPTGEPYSFDEARDPFDPYGGASLPIG
jgi:type IV secretory pathway VirB2 component (pilin)